MRSILDSRVISIALLLITATSLTAPILSLAALPQQPERFNSQQLPAPTSHILIDPLPKPAASHPKMDSVLLELAWAAQTARQTANNLANNRSLRTQDGRVQVQITAAFGQTQAAGEIVHNLGGEVSGRSTNGLLLQAWLPPQTLLRLIEHDSIAYVRPPAQVIYVDEPQTVAVSTEASLLINAPAWHASGLNGGGVKVAIIDAGFDGYLNLLGGELPTNVTVMNFVDGENEQDVTGATNHGAAVAEVIYDIAPHASLYLVKVNTLIDLQEAVDWLIAQNVDLINTSVGWFNVSPGDGTGFFADLAQQAREKGIFWVTAGGNQRQFHWGGTGTFKTAPNDNYPSLSFNDTQNVNFFVSQIGKGDIIQGFLRWDDWTTVDQDFDLTLYSWDPFQTRWTKIVSSSNLQNGQIGQTPTEHISVIADKTAYYGFVIHKINSTRDDVNFELFTSLHPDNELDEKLNARSLYNLADAPSVFTASAINIAAPYPQESYSSEGPTNGPGGAALGGLIKPDIASFAGVTTNTYGANAFSGAAAAAAHVSGAAALVKSAAPSYTPAQTQWYLQSQAIDMGAPGMDTIYGSGRLYLGNPAVFLSSPNISGLPDQLLAQNSSHSQAVDLWAYTSDPYTPDEQLRFTIDNSPNPSAGISIADNRYLSIQPLPNWNGQTQVSVRVTTPYTQTDTDQLMVTILAPPDIANLPNQVLPVNGSLNPAIDLWLYTSDAYYSDEQLTFSLDPLLDSQAGLSLSENRYIKINPLQDWTGQAQVSVQVHSPIGLSDVDGFSLHVLAPPDIVTLPDQFVPTNASRSQAIDLWAYTFDPYISDEQMTFTIDNLPAPEAGVSLSQNRYIDIQPNSDWTGQTQVTVRAATPYAQSDAETFTVNVGRYKIWNGSLSLAWEEGLNWTPDGIPVIEDTVIVPDTTNQPLLSGPAAVNNLMIEPNAILDLGTNFLSVEGEVSNYGAMKQSQWVHPGETSHFLHLTNLAGDQDKYFGATVLPAATGSPGSIQQQESFVSITVAGEQYCALRFSGVKRCYELQTSQPLTASLTFYFSQIEANSLNPETLVAYWLDGTWSEESGSYTSGSNSLGYYLAAPKWPLFGVFSLDQSGSPTQAFMLPLVMNSFIPLKE